MCIRTRRVNQASRLNIVMEVGLFCAVGGAQLLVDWMVFVAVSASGAGVVVSNLSGRISGALVGFLLNGRLTFRLRASASGWVSRFGRFLALWFVLTGLSTAALLEVRDVFGLGGAWVGKLVIEAMLAVLSFVTLKYWVYRGVTHGSR